MDPLTVLAVGSGVGSAIGNVSQALAAGQQNRTNTNLEQLLGMRGLDIQSSAVGDTLRRQMESMPLRDRLLYSLQNRVGQSPQRFNAGGMWGNAAAPASPGGIDFSALQNANAQYTPGAGGTRPDIAAQMLNRLGYTGMGGGTGNAWQQALTQKFGSPADSWANQRINTNTGDLQVPPQPQTQGTGGPNVMPNPSPLPNIPLGPGNLGGPGLSTTPSNPLGQSGSSLPNSAPSAGSPGGYTPGNFTPSPYALSAASSPPGSPGSGSASQTSPLQASLMSRLFRGS